MRRRRERETKEIHREGVRHRQTARRTQRSTDIGNRKNI